MKVACAAGMGTYATNTKLDQLKLVDGPDMAAPTAKASPPPAEPGPALGAFTQAPAMIAPAPEATGAQPVPQLGSQNAGESHDPFMAEAAREFDIGQVEQPLWVRSLAQAGGDVALAKPAYLRARAVALRLARRDKRERLPGREAATGGGSPSKSGPNEASRGGRNGKRIALIAGGVAAIGVIAGFVFMRPESAPDHAAVGMVAPVAKPAPAARAQGPKPEVAANPAPPREDYARKVQEFKDARNWNVLVLYAAEWTRKEPEDAQAWKELGGGYLRMRQYDDALEATRKAVMKAPNDAELWQNLGLINVALHQPAAALSAFEKASELNSRDVTSRVQAGLLNLELNHLPQARADFASALEINPLDVEALCGSATVARKDGRAKDAEAIARQIKANGLECREPEPPAPPPAVAANPPASKKAALPRGR